MDRQGVVLVVSGPSGVGKGTVIRELISRHPEVHKSVSWTTRKPRPEEVEGEDYHFVSVSAFRDARAQKGFLESATVHKDISYGTPERPVLDALERGEDIILEIDYQGARTVRGVLGETAVLVFIAPPSWQALEDRLTNRQTESAADVRKRLRTARREIANISLFEYVIVNRQVPQATAELEAILLAERRRAGRVDIDGLVRELLGGLRGEAGEQ